MITTENIKQSLGRKFNPSVAYVVSEKGPSLASKLNKGYKNLGKLDDGLTEGSTELFILSPPAGDS